MKEVPFIGHVATGEGLRPDPSKAQAICEMPPPENVAGIWGILEMSQYLSKFLPRLSDITKTLSVKSSCKHLHASFFAWIFRGNPPYCTQFRRV